MHLLDIIPLTKIPHTRPQILSYFSGQKLPSGAFIQVPLGKKKGNGVVVGARSIADYKMEIKRANFELRNIGKIISVNPILTKKQIELALFLGQYYFASPGLFAKMMLPKKITSKSQIQIPKQIPNPNSQKLILTPTITLAEKITANYKNAILWHSGLTTKRLNELWWKIKNSQIQTIIGTRSSVFLPFRNLKKIIIEDETNPNHKSWDMFPHWRAHEAAQKLAKLFNSKLTISNKYHTVGVHEFKPQIIDMRQEIKNGNFSIFSVDLYEAVKNVLAKNKQVILFINRRGAANFVLCRDCGYIAKCPNCDAALAYHLINNRLSLLCHHCGVKDTPPKNCPKCKSWRIKTVGSGSQKVEIETQKFFPDAKILRLDSDNAPKPKNQQKIITDFVDKKADVLIATQIIFSWLTELTAAKPEVVAILSADTLLHIPDFRSGERTFRTIMALQSLQSVVASVPRLRDAKQSRDIVTIADSNPPAPPFTSEVNVDAPFAQKGAGEFFIQTYNPDNSVLKYIRDNDYKGFIKEDMATRRTLNYPPFSQIVKLTFRHRDPKKAGQEAKILQVKLSNLASSPRLRGGLRWGDKKQNLDTTSPQPPPQPRRGGKNYIELSAALPAFIPRERGKFIWNIIIKFKIENLKLKINNEFLSWRNSLLQYVPQNWEIDVDPENLL